MPDVASVMSQLKAKGTEKGRATYARHGNSAEHTLGVSVADLKAIAKTIKGRQLLACQLYQTGMMEAMYLAGIVAQGSQMSKAELNAWAEAAANMPMVSEYPVAWVTVESPYAAELAVTWTKSKTEHVASAGWCTYAALVKTRRDEELDLTEIEKLLQTVVKKIHSAPNRVRLLMNSFVIAVGSYVNPLAKQAREAAQRIGPVSVDMGDTACEVRPAAEVIDKLHLAGKAGLKRKTVRC